METGHAGPVGSSERSPAHVIAVGGMDPGGGAGVVRDWVTAHALGASAELVVAALTVQSPAGVHAVEPRRCDDLVAAFAHALAEAPAGRTAVKVGMLGTAENVAAVAGALDGFAGPVVLDPVLRATSGGALLERADGAALALLAPLLARATVVTPNAGEAEQLAGVPVRSPEEAASAGRALLARGAHAVLVKGGHLVGPHATDVLVWPGGERSFVSPRTGGPSPRGTGCALATALAVELARGVALPEAVMRAKRWLGERIARAEAVRGEWHLPVGR